MFGFSSNNIIAQVFPRQAPPALTDAEKAKVVANQGGNELAKDTMAKSDKAKRQAQALGKEKAKLNVFVKAQKTQSKGKAG